MRYSIVQALIAISPIAFFALARFGLMGMVLIAVLGLAASAVALRGWCPTKAEWAGGAFCVLTASYVDTLDDVLGLTQRISVGVLLLGAIFIGLRWRRALEVARSPMSLALGLFLAQQVASALILGNPHWPGVAQSRIALFLAFNAVAVLTQGEVGRPLVSGAVMMGVMLSLPMMMRELIAPGELMLPSLLVQDVGRAAGFYGQPNNAGAVLDFALAFAAAMYIDRTLSLRAFLIIGVAVLAGILGTGSRGAFAVAVLIGVGAAVISLRARAGMHGALAGVCLLAGLLMLAPDVVSSSLVSGIRKLDDLGITDLSRVEDVAQALVGSPDALMDHDSHRMDLAAQAFGQAQDRPIFGHGTGQFMMEWQRSHMQLLEILGENGIVGALFYGLFLWTILRTLLRLRSSVRWGAYLVAGAWMLTHFHNHNLVEFRFFILPVAYVCGIGAESAKEQRES